jgi:hypothetical protein
MRTGTWIAGAIAGTLVASSAWAQSAANLLGSLNVQQRANQPIDMSNVVAPVPRSSGPPYLSNLFHFPNLTNLFSKSRNPNPPAFSTSPFPAPSSFPSSKYPNSFQPMLPFYPKQ